MEQNDGQGRADRSIAAVSRALREHGSLSQADIAKITGMGKATVSRAVARLQKIGLVIGAGPSARSGPGPRGRRAEVLSLNPVSGFCIGVQLGSDDIRAVLADVSHTVLASRATRLPRNYATEQALDAAAALVEALHEEAGVPPALMTGVGIAVPSPVHPRTGEVIRSSALGPWSNAPIAALFEERLGHPVVLDNESNCAALAEFTWGAAKGFGSVVYVKVERGVGGAVFANGRLLRGIAGGAGEFGHVVHDPEGPLCRCGNRGCYEVYLSDWALLRPVRAIHDERFSMDDLVRHAREGDKGCRRIIVDAAEILARCIAGACNLLNPEAVVVAGDLLPAGDLLMAPLRAALARHVLIPLESPDAEHGTRLLTASLGRDAATLGAMGLALRQIGSPELP